MAHERAAAPAGDHGRSRAGSTSGRTHRQTLDLLGDESRWKEALATAERRHDNRCIPSRFDAHGRGHHLSETQLEPLARENVPSLVGLGKRLVTPERKTG